PSTDTTPGQPLREVSRGTHGGGSPQSDGQAPAMTLLWPRLQTAAARAHFLELRDLSRQDLIDRASTEHPLQTYASTGGSRISRVQLDVVRKRIVEAASEFGYPHK